MNGTHLQFLKSVPAEVSLSDFYLFRNAVRQWLFSYPTTVVLDDRSDMDVAKQLTGAHLCRCRGLGHLHWRDFPNTSLFFSLLALNLWEFVNRRVDSVRCGSVAMGPRAPCLSDSSAFSSLGTPMWLGTYWRPIRLATSVANSSRRFACGTVVIA